MTLKEFLENICIDEEWRVQYYDDDVVVVFDTGNDDSITEEKLIEEYGNKRVEAIFIDTVKRYYETYPQIVLEIEE